MKQSFTRIYFESEKASDCRSAVQQMSMQVKEMDDWKASAAIQSLTNDVEQRVEEEIHERRQPSSSKTIKSGNKLKRHCVDRESTISVANNQFTVITSGSKWAKYGLNDDNSDD
jgi:hypothetical protein